MHNFEQMGTDIFTYTDSIQASIPRQLPITNQGVWAGFVRDPDTGMYVAKYGDGRDITQTNLTYVGDLSNTNPGHACTAISGKIIIAISLLVNRKVRSENLFCLS